MNRSRLAVFVKGAVIGWLAMGTPWNAADSDRAIRREELQAELRPFTRGAPSPVGSLFVQYLRFYGLEIGGAEYSIGTLESAGLSIALQTFAPPASRGLVVVTHGYYDHVGSLNHLIRRLVAEGYTVAAYDQPGHGLSGGAPGSVDSFATYAAVLSEVVGLLRRDFGGQCHFVGFSLGGAGAIELLTGGRGAQVQGVVLLAPLVRVSFWNASRLWYHLAGKGEVLVRRVLGGNSSDAAYLEFVRRDPLQLRYVSRAWFGALMRWNEELETREPSDRLLLVLQGTADMTVAWRHNLKVLRRLFPCAVVRVLPAARHQLPNEGQALRQEVLDAVVDHLAEAAGR